MPKTRKVEKQHLPQEELDTLQIVPERNKKTDADVMRLAKADPPKASKPAAQQQADPHAQAKTTSEIMSLDIKHDEEITKFLKPGIRAFSEGREFEGLTNIEKLDALVYAMRDEDYFAFAYVRHTTPTMPQIVEETFSSKKGDCDELSRVFVALAKELGITDLTQCYVSFRNTETGKHEGHAALFFVDGQVLYADPGFEKTYSFDDKNYKSIEEAKKDPEFLKKLAEWQGKTRGGVWTVEEVATMKKPSALEATYNFEVASYAIAQSDWNTAKEQAKEALTKGMECSATYFLLGQAYYQLDDFPKAIANLEKAVEKKKTDPRYYAALGDSYSRDGQHVTAANAFREQTRLQPDNFEAISDLVTELNSTGKSVMGEKKYADAVKYYGEAERVLSDFLKNEAAKQVDKVVAEGLLTEVRQNLKDARRKNK